MKLIAHNKNNFDFLRFLAASMVIISHSVPLTGDGIYYTEWLAKGQIHLGGLAVDMFFIISGYLIVASYLRINSLFKYLLFRILRLLPALIVVTLLTVFVAGPLVTVIPGVEYFNSSATYYYFENILLYPIRYSLPGFDTYAPSAYHQAVNGSLWTLSNEFTCYLFIAALGFLKILNKYTIFLIFTLCLFFSNFFVPIFNPDNPEWLLNTFQSIYLPLDQLLGLMSYFFAGSLFYFYRETIDYHWKWFAVALVIISISCQMGHGLNLILPILGTYVVFYFSFSPIIKLHNFGKYGDFSYGIYLYGFLVQQLVIMVFDGKMSNTMNWLISLPIAILLGFLSYHLVEKQCMKLKALVMGMTK